jgi:hypothetical protein
MGSSGTIRGIRKHALESEVYIGLGRDDNDRKITVTTPLPTNREKGAENILNFFF